MPFEDAFYGLNISASGLAAERLRMETIAQNIANAQSTRTPEGGPYRRKDVVFAAVMNAQMTGEKPGKQLGGVQAVDVVDDPSEFIRIYQPGHPDADKEGMVSYPNVHLPIEMTNLITASRAYEANVKVAQTFKQMLEQSLALLRS